MWGKNYQEENNSNYFCVWINLFFLFSFFVICLAQTIGAINMFKHFFKLKFCCYQLLADPGFVCSSNHQKKSLKKEKWKSNAWSQLLVIVACFFFQVKLFSVCPYPISLLWPTRQSMPVREWCSAVNDPFKKKKKKNVLRKNSNQKHRWHIFTNVKSFFFSCEVCFSFLGLIYIFIVCLSLSHCVSA